MSDHRLDRIHADEFIGSAIIEAEADAARRYAENIRRGGCVVCEQIGEHEDGCPEGFHPVTENDVREAMLRKGWVIPTTAREAEIVEQLFPESEVELPTALKEPPSIYCYLCDHALQVDGNGICRAAVPGCGDPCGCRCKFRVEK